MGEVGEIIIVLITARLMTRISIAVSPTNIVTCTEGATMRERIALIKHLVIRIVL